MSELKPADALAQHRLGSPAPSPAAAPDAVRQMHLGWHSRGYLPHCDASGLVQHIVFGLADALPKSAKPPSAIHGDQMLDAGYGECLIRKAECAVLVQQALLRDDGKRYRLIGWCIMPNHVHAIAEQVAGAPLSTIVQTWKSVTSHNINQRLGRKGRLWRREYFDRFMRDDDHLSTVIEYVENNPVRAKLAVTADQWKWSSARHRQPAVAGEGAGGPR